MFVYRFCFFMFFMIFSSLFFAFVGVHYLEFMSLLRGVGVAPAGGPSPSARPNKHCYYAANAERS